MPEEIPVDQTSPLWLAWLDYQRTEDYRNTLEWWGKPPQEPEGTLWAAFMAGFNAGAGLSDHARAVERLRREEGQP